MSHDIVENVHLKALEIVKFHKKKFEYEKIEYELDMCLSNTDAPGGNNVKIWQNSLSPTFWPRPTPGTWDQVWLLYHDPNFIHCIL